MKSDNFHYLADGTNITLQQLQADLVSSLNQMASTEFHPTGVTIHVITCKGDWKYNHEFLQSRRFYGKSANSTEGLCMRCLANRTTWMDLEEPWNNPQDLATARLTAVGNDIPIKGLSGWTPEMHVPDLLHTIFLGTGRDLIGALCMEIIHQPGFVGSTYNERLSSLRKRMQAWCVEHGHRPSTIEELRFWDVFGTLCWLACILKFLGYKQ